MNCPSRQSTPRRRTFCSLATSPPPQILKSTSAESADHAVTDGYRSSAEWTSFFTEFVLRK